MRISECGVRSARRIQGQLRHASLFRTLHSPLQIENGCRGWNRTSIRAFKGRCPTIRRPGNKWWPARVTRPVLRIKSPLHHFNACRPKIGSPSRSSTGEGWCSWQDSHLHCRRSRRRASSGWATRAEFGAPTRNCTELSPIPKECIAQNALGPVNTN